MTKEEFKILEIEYNKWLRKHPKGDQNYSSFSHMRRTLEFSCYFRNQRIWSVEREPKITIDERLEWLEQKMEETPPFKQAFNNLNQRHSNLLEAKEILYKEGLST
jgi:hypothetical protein